MAGKALSHARARYSSVLVFMKLEWVASIGHSTLAYVRTFYSKKQRMR